MEILLIETIDTETNEAVYYNHITRSFTNDISKATRYYSKKSIQLRYDLAWLKNKCKVSVVRDDTDIGTYLSIYKKPNWVEHTKDILSCIIPLILFIPIMLIDLLITNVKKYHP